MTAVNIEDPAQLTAYLRHAGHIMTAEEPQYRVLSGGVSNRTVWVTRASGEAWVIKQALPKLRVQVDWFSDPARIERESAGLKHLGRLVPGRTPTLVFEDPDSYILAMAAVPEPHHNWKQLLLGGQLQNDHVRQFGQLLGNIHHRAFEAQTELAAVFAERRFFESLRLEPYYAYTATQVPAAAPFLHALIAVTRHRQLTLTHGDYSPKNVLVSQGKLVLLDHEVIHWGDPAFDVGFSMTHLLSKAHHLATQRKDFATAALTHWQSYHAIVRHLPWSADLESFAVQHTLACLLARVDGRSPLEYLTPAGQNQQRQAVLHLITTPPATITTLIDRFLTQISTV